MSETPLRDCGAMSKVLTALFIVCLCFTAGCYRYVPLEEAVAPSGTLLRARLTDAGAEEMQRYFGPGVVEVKGPLVSWNDEGLSMLRETFLRREGFPATTVTDTLSLLSQHLAGVDVRELHGTRTAVLSVAILAGVVATVFAAQIFGGGAETGPEGGDDDPDAAVLFRIPIRIGFP
jgi:hypothetical protein